MNEGTCQYLCILYNCAKIYKNCVFITDLSCFHLCSHDWFQNINTYFLAIYVLFKGEDLHISIFSFKTAFKPCSSKMCSTKNI